MTVNKANILEIFSSIQGEGIYIGYRQLFIRFSGCNLGCKYCDTDFSESEICKIEICPGSGNFKNIKPDNLGSISTRNPKADLF